MKKPNAMSTNKTNTTSMLSDATGPVAIPMTNDYLFRALMQRNNNVLKGLICSLLHLSPTQVDSVTITNPIELGRAVDEKDFMLDVKCLLNDSTIINLEMQVINEHNWSERSLSYLCRSFDNLNRGDDYLNVKTAIHISLLDFTLFPDLPEFYSTNMMINIRNHKIFSDRLRLSVLDLTQIKLATEEDKQYHIDYWASLFKATTWEEIKMLAQKDSFIEEASNTIFQLTEEEQIRQQCEAREDFLYWQRRKDNYINELEEANAKQQAVIAEKDAAIAKNNTTITEQNALIAEKDALIAELQARVKTLET